MAGRALRTNLSEVTRRVRLFGNIVGWVLGDVYRNAKGQFVLIFALSVLGVIARLCVLAVLMTFVHAQTSGRPVVVGGFELPSDTGFWTLTLWGGLVLVLSVVTGLANYLAEVRNFRLAREAMRRVVDRAMTVVAAGQTRPLSRAASHWRCTVAIRLRTLCSRSGRSACERSRWAGTTKLRLPTAAQWRESGLAPNGHTARAVETCYSTGVLAERTDSAAEG